MKNVIFAVLAILVVSVMCKIAFSEADRVAIEKATYKREKIVRDSLSMDSLQKSVVLLNEQHKKSEDSLQRWYKTSAGKTYLAKIAEEKKEEERRQKEIEKDRIKQEFISKFISDNFGHVHCWEIEADISRHLNDPDSYKHIETVVSVSSQRAKVWYTGEVEWLD